MKYIKQFNLKKILLVLSIFSLFITNVAYAVNLNCNMMDMPKQMDMSSMQKNMDYGPNCNDNSCEQMSCECSDCLNYKFLSNSVISLNNNIIINQSDYMANHKIIQLYGSHPPPKLNV